AWCSFGLPFFVSSLRSLEDLLEPRHLLLSRKAPVDHVVDEAALLLREPVMVLVPVGATLRHFLRRQLVIIVSRLGSLWRQCGAESVCKAVNVEPFGLCDSDHCVASRLDLSRMRGAQHQQNGLPQLVHSPTLSSAVRAYQGISSLSSPRLPASNAGC